jgi:hypothetical protein
MEWLSSISYSYSEKMASHIYRMVKSSGCFCGIYSQVIKAMQVELIYRIYLPVNSLLIIDGNYVLWKKSQLYRIFHCKSFQISCHKLDELQISLPFHQIHHSIKFAIPLIMTSYPESLAVKKFDQDEVFYCKDTIHFIPKINFGLVAH